MRLIRAVFIFLVGAVVSLAITYALVIRPRVKTWGRDPQEEELHLPGDDLIVDPSHTETRGIDIAAPPAAVWPWLVQMGFGRAGWYSFDAVGMKGTSADEILPQFQSLAVGDSMPTHPGGGFLVKVVEPQRALVLYTDTDLVRSQATQADTTSYPEFSASWAFYLQPVGDSGTRLIERFRAKTPGSGPATAVLGEIMGTGIVLMTRKQMLGIKERVERLGPPAAAEWPAVDQPIVDAPIVSEMMDPA